MRIIIGLTDDRRIKVYLKIINDMNPHKKKYIEYNILYLITVTFGH